MDAEQEDCVVQEEATTDVGPDGSAPPAEVGTRGGVTRRRFLTLAGAAAAGLAL
jgi:hypothetical protein